MLLNPKKKHHYTLSDSAFYKLLLTAATTKYLRGFSLITVLVHLHNEDGATILCAVHRSNPIVVSLEDNTTRLAEWGDNYPHTLKTLPDTLTLSSCITHLCTCTQSDMSFDWWHRWHRPQQRQQSPDCLTESSRNPMGEITYFTPSQWLCQGNSAFHLGQALCQCVCLTACACVHGVCLQACVRSLQLFRGGHCLFATNLVTSRWTLFLCSNSCHF